MAEFLDRLVNARDSRTGWVKETASSILSLKTRFESGEITESKYVQSLDVLKSAIIANGILNLKNLL